MYWKHSKILKGWKSFNICTIERSPANRGTSCIWRAYGTNTETIILKVLQATQYPVQCWYLLLSQR
ncbi:hypothetical protein ACVN5I_26280, partial [Escherichia coli]